MKQVKDVGYGFHGGGPYYIETSALICQGNKV